jgi:hypothetical protein
MFFMRERNFFAGFSPFRVLRLNLGRVFYTMTQKTSRRRACFINFMTIQANSVTGYAYGAAWGRLMAGRALYFSLDYVFLMAEVEREIFLPAPADSPQ